MRTELGIHAKKLFVGNKVRSYDFPNRDDCFIEGVVLAAENPVNHNFGIEWDGLVKVKTTRRVIEGRELEVTDDMTTKFPALGVIIESENRIRQIRADD